MSLKELTLKQVLEDTFDGPGWRHCFYMAARGIEFICEQANENWPDSDDRWSPEGFKYFLTPDGDLIAERKTLGMGTREPDYVWDGSLWEDWHEASWICSEDELSPDQRALMHRVAKHCPGGLGGWL